MGNWQSVASLDWLIVPLVDRFVTQSLIDRLIDCIEWSCLKMTSDFCLIYFFPFADISWWVTRPDGLFGAAHSSALLQSFLCGIFFRSTCRRITTAADAIRADHGRHGRDGFPVGRLLRDNMSPPGSLPDSHQRPIMAGEFHTKNAGEKR